MTNQLRYRFESSELIKPDTKDRLNHGALRRTRVWEASRLQRPPVVSYDTGVLALVVGALSRVYKFCSPRVSVTAMAARV